MPLLLCPNCPIGERARVEFCASSPAYYMTVLLLPYLGLWLMPPLIELVGRARSMFRDGGRRFAVRAGKA